MERQKLKKVSQYVVSSAMLANTLAAPAAVFAENNQFDSSAVKAAIKELMEAGIMTGDGKGNLNLEGKLTRMEAASILARALGLNVSTPVSSSFSDVSGDSWGLKYINALAKAGIMVGSDNQFRPNALMTKEELAVVLVRITQINVVGKGNNIPVSDSESISDWAKPFVQAALESNLLQAQDGVFGGKSEVKRQDVAVIANDFIQSPKFIEYKESIQTLVDEGKKVSNSDPTV